MAGKRNEDLVLEGAQLYFRNFQGKPDKFNTEGRRTFCVLIDPSVVEAMTADGWNVKFLKPKEEGDPPVPYLQITVNFSNIPPTIWLICGRKKTRLDEESVGSLDWADIINCDLVISPYRWNVRGQSGIRGYLKTMYVTIQEDVFESKYANPNSDPNVPWESNGIF